MAFLIASIASALRPIVFSGGLYNHFPQFFYNEVLEQLENTHTILDLKAPMTRQNFDSLCDEYECDKLPLICHSALDASILQSHRLEKALLIDPAVVPAVGALGLVPAVIKPRAPVHIVLSKLYSSFVKAPFQPDVVGANVLQCTQGGHSDLLTGLLPNIGAAAGIAADPKNRVEFKSFLKKYISEWAGDSGHSRVQDLLE